MGRQKALQARTQLDSRDPDYIEAEEPTDEDIAQWESWQEAMAELDNY